MMELNSQMVSGTITCETWPVFEERGYTASNCLLCRKYNKYVWEGKWTGFEEGCCGGWTGSGHACIGQHHPDHVKDINTHHLMSSGLCNLGGLRENLIHGGASCIFNSYCLSQTKDKGLLVVCRPDTGANSNFLRRVPFVVWPRGHMDPLLAMTGGQQLPMNPNGEAMEVIHHLFRAHDGIAKCSQRIWPLLLAHISSIELHFLRVVEEVEVGAG